MRLDQESSKTSFFMADLGSLDLASVFRIFVLETLFDKLDQKDDLEIVSNPD